MTKRSDIVYHGDLYIRHVHEVGYPTAEDRKAFNNRFYRIYKKRITNHREAITAVGNVHHFLKKETAPGWVKRIPALHRLFDEVLTDYKEKYGNGKGNEVEPKPVAPLLRVELRSKARMEKNRLLAEKKANSSFPATLTDALAEQQQRYEEEVVLPSDVMVQPVTALQAAFFPELPAGSQQKYEMEGFSIQKSIIPPVQDERMEEMGVSMSPLQDEAPAANWLEQMEEMLIPLKEEPKEEDFTVPGRKENRKETKKTPKKKTIEAIPVQNTVQQTLSGLTKVTIKKEVDEAMVLAELGVSRITEQGTRGIPLLKTGMRPVEEDLVRNREARLEEEQLGRIAQLEEEIRKAIPVQETTIGQKNSAIETKPSLFDVVSVNQATTSGKMMGNTPAQMRIQQLEREAAEKEALFMEWKRKNEDEKKKVAERMARLEEELKAAQHQLATKDGMLRQLAGKAQVLTEKMELKDIIIRDKERTIQILSQQGK